MMKSILVSGAVKGRLVPDSSLFEANGSNLKIVQVLGTLWQC